MVLNGFDWGYFIIMNEEEEIWKDIPNYEGYYQVSNLGIVKSLSRVLYIGNGFYRTSNSKIVKGSDSGGYFHVALSKNGVCTRFNIHQIVAITFLNHIPNGHKLVVDHINGIKADNRLSNLQIVTQRENTSSCFRGDRVSLSSKFTGVSWHKYKRKWTSSIWTGEKLQYLGCFLTEIEASDAYQKELSKIST